MRYETGFGDRIDVERGDTVYVDEGDSYGAREFTGVAIATRIDTITVRVIDGNVNSDPAEGDVITLHPDTVADMEVWAHGEVGA